MATVAEKLLTAEDYAQMPDPGYPTELVRGKVVETGSTGFQHGKIASTIGRLIGNFADDHDLGHVVTNGSGVITGRTPDSVRGPDIAYYGYASIPKGPLTTGYPSVPPDLIFEVLSPSDRWPLFLNKVSEYLSAGVVVVCVVDPRTSTIYLYRVEAPLEVVGAKDEWSVPDILPNLTIPVRQFFE